MIKKNILWLDDDVSEIIPCAMELRENNYDVTIVETVSEAEQLLNSKHYDLLILDIMIQTYPIEEAADYPISKTESGYNTGLIFYCKIKSILEEKEIEVLALSIRMDSLIKEKFLMAGLPLYAFMRKRDILSNVQFFVNKIGEIFSE